jgi:lysophospholipase L1-like esterase
MTLDTQSNQHRSPAEDGLDEGPRGFWAPWQQLGFAGAVSARIGVVVGAAVIIGLCRYLTQQWLVVLIALILASVVFWVWRKSIQRNKPPWAPAIYILTIVIGVLLLTSNRAARDLGVPPPVIVYGGLGAVLSGYAGLVWIARGSARVRRRSAIRLELAAMVVAVAACWVGLWLLERSRGANPVSYSLIIGSLVVLFVMLSLLSESLIAYEQDPEKPGPQLRRLVPETLYFSSWRWPAAAAAVIVAGFAWLVAQVNFSALIVAGLVVGLVLFFFAVAANGVADVAAVLIVVSLSWALAPRTVAFDTEPLAAGQTVLVALGDSYISGEGASRFFEGTNDKEINECRRAPTAYGPLLVERETTPDLTRLVFLACSGAKAAHLDARIQYQGEPVGGPPRLRDNGVWERGESQLEQLDDVLRAVRPKANAPTEEPEQDLHGLVVMSLGGNDAGFGTIASSCLGLGDCGDIDEAWTLDLGLVRSRLDRVYAALRGVIGPNVPVLVVPYPVPLAAKRCDVSAMTQSEHTSIRRFVGQLNAKVEQAASDAGFFYLDIESAFDGHRICDTDNVDDWYFNYIAANPTGGSFEALSNPRNWLHNSFHPNAEGHRAIADAIEAWVATNGDEIVGSRFELPESPFRLAYLTGPGARPSEELERVGSDPCAVSGSGWEGDWTTCETARALRGFLIPSMLFVGATWIVGFTLLHLFRRLTDPDHAVRRGNRSAAHDH